MGVDREVVATLLRMLTIVRMLAEEFSTLSLRSTVALVSCSKNAGRVTGFRNWDMK